jgi:hypothetical protein
MNLQRTFAVICIMTLLLSTNAATCQTPQLTSRVLVPRGVALKFSLMSPLDSRIAKVGDDVPLRLERPLVVDGVRLLESGTIAHGRVTRVKHAGPKCRRGQVDWKVEAITFGDSSRAKTYKMSSGAPGWEPPQQYPSDRIARGRHDTMNHVSGWVEMAILSPFWVPLVLIAWRDGDEKCTNPGSDFQEPANSIIAVAVSKAHHVRY